MDYRPFGLLDMTPGFPAGGVAGRTPSGADDLGRLLYSMTGAGGAQDAAGLLGGPSVRENLRSGNNFDAGLQMLAALPVVGMLGSVPRAAGKVARGAQDAAKAAEEARGIIAYHGSPHSFDKFDLSKIGTGEGAQAYGHGLYFADNEDVARGYRDRIAGANWIDKRGVPLSSNTIANDIMDQARKDGLGPVEANDAAGMWSIVARDGEGASNFPGYKSVKTVLDRHGLQLKPNGSMYQVRINADPNAFLDWDRPFANADEVERFAAKFDNFDPGIRKKIEDWGYTRQQRGQPMPDGNDIMREVFGGVEGQKGREATRAFREAGIPGIKYLDAGSRGSGEGSRNYVVFDDSLIDILKKYGLIGLLGGGAAASGVSGMNNPASEGRGAPGL